MSKKENGQKGFFSWKLNVGISKISNLMLVIFIAIYATIAIIALNIVKNREVSSVFTPNYEHTFYNDEINTHFTIVPQRTYDSQDKESLNYRVVFYNQGRYINNSEPGYRFSSFKAQAGLVTDIEKDDVNKMYYFTEQSGSTSTSHNYTISNPDGDKNPKYMYSRIEYRSGSEQKVATFKEEIWLLPDSNDIKELDNVYNTIVAPKTNEYKTLTDEDQKTKKLNEIKNLNISNSSDVRVGTFQITATRDDELSRYSCVVRCNVDDRTKPYHIDLQTWIQTEDGNYLPFIGAYNFSSDHDYYSSGSYSLYDQTKAKYICAKVVMYDSEGNGTVAYYKQEVNQLSSPFVIGNSGVDYTKPYQQISTK